MPNFPHIIWESHFMVIFGIDLRDIRKEYDFPILDECLNCNCIIIGSV